MKEILNILIIDDNSALANNIKNIIIAEISNCNAETAGNGKSATEAFGKKNFDLALVDIKLPDISGEELLRQLSAGSPATEFIIITGHATIDSAIASVTRKEIISYLRKPVDFDILLPLIRHISEKKKMAAQLALSENKLNKSENLYRTLVETSPDAIVFYNIQGQIVAANSRTYSMFGYSGEDEFSNAAKTTFDHIALPDRERSMQNAGRILNGEILSGQEYTVVNNDGTEFPVEINSSVVKNENGKPYGLISVIRDISKRKKAEEEVRESEKRFRALMDSFYDMIYITDYNFMMMYSNIALEHHTGYSPRDFNKNINDVSFVHSDDRHKVNGFIKKFMSDNKQYSDILENRFVKGNGEIRWHSTIITKLKFSGQPALQFICRDVTDRKKAEEEIISQKNTLDAIFESSPFIMMLLDKDGSVIKMNKTGEVFAGKEESEIINVFCGEVINCKNVYNRDIRCGAHEACVGCTIRNCLNKTFTEKTSVFNQEGTITVIKNGAEITMNILVSSNIVEQKDENYVLISVVDITERKKAEEALRKERDFSLSLTETAQTIILLLDTRGKIVYFNPYMEELAGYKLKEVAGKDWFDTFLPENTRVETRKLFLNAIGDIKTKGNIDRIITKDNKLLFIEWYDKTMKDADGNITGLLSIGQDITARKQAEDELEKSEQRFRAIFEQAGVGVGLLNTKTGQFIRVNKKYCDMVGYSVQEMLQKTFMDITFPDDILFNKNKNAQLIKGDVTSYSFEKRYVHKDGSIVWGSITTSPLWKPGEKPETYLHIAIVENISERKKAEKALKTSEEKFRNYIERAPDGVFIVDDKKRFIEVNQSACRITGYSREEILKMSVRDMLTNESFNDGLAHFNKIMETGKVTSDIWHRHKDGSVRCLTVDAVKLSENRILGFCKDITDRKKAEIELKDKEAFNYALFRKNPIATIIVDTEGRVINSNLMQEKLGNYSPRKGDVMYKDYARRHTINMYDELMWCIKNGQTKEFPEMKYLDSFLSVTIAPFNKGAIITCIDITERKLSDNIIYQSKKDWEDTFDSISDMVTIHDIDYNIIRSNKAGKELLKLPGEKLSGLKCYLYYHGADKPPLGCPSCDCIKSGLPGVCELFEPSLNLYLEIRAIPRLDSNNKVVGLIHIVRDITERKKAEIQLKDKEAFNYAMFRHNPIATIVVDKEGRVLETNNKQKIFGTSNPKPGDVMYKDYARYHTINMYEELMGCIKNREIKEFPELKYNERFLAITIAPFDKGAIITCMDISLRKKAEEAIVNLNEDLELKVKQRTEELDKTNLLLQNELDEKEKILEKEKELNLMKSHFISTISHEFRTPLTGIYSTVQLMELYSYKWDEAKKKERYNSIYSSIRYTNLLLDDVAFIGKDDSNKIAFNPMPVKFETVCEQTIADVNAYYSLTGRINFIINPRSFEAMVDDSLIRHILSNLLSNAVKYSPAGKPVEFTVEKKEKEIIMVVKDQGIGIPEADMKYLFETFYRASNVETIKGTGLGLPIVKRCVNMHRGTISVQSKEGEGTTVSVKIPV